MAGGSVSLAMGYNEDKRRRPGVYRLRLLPSVFLLGASPVHHETKRRTKIKNPEKKPEKNKRKKGEEMG
jgi:hypothetical protein